jgi:protein SCO1/2
MQKSIPLWIQAVAGLLVGLIVVIGFALANQTHKFAGTLLEQPKEMFNFQLKGPEDRLVRLSDYRGKYVLVFFGYTSCPDVCPTTLKDLAGILKELGNQADKVQVLFISVDPEKDTPKRLSGFIKQFDSRILGLSGSLQDIQLTAKEYGIFFEKKPFGTEGGYSVDHTATLMLLDPNGGLRVAYPYGTSYQEIAADIRYLLSQ